MNTRPVRTKLRHLPNIITALRLCLLMPFLFSLYHGDYLISFYLFIIAGFSDGLDGYLARRYHWQSTLGGIIDPLADKLFVSASYISLAYLEQLPWWLVALVFGRDLIIIIATASWQRVFGHLECRPSLLSKVNTVAQGLFVFIILFSLSHHAIAKEIYTIMLYSIVVTTSASLVHYAWIWGKKAYYRLKERRSTLCS